MRAIAVLPVIFFHAGFEAFPGGFVGVDVFYVISGYLITAILLRELREERFSIVKFYERRARRILPALFVVLAVCVPFAYLWMLPREFARFWESVLSVGTFTSNIHFWRTTDYFAPSADNELLLHTWSLAVEEQFYLLFPIYLFLVWRFWKSALVVITATLALGSFLLAEWGWRNVPVANFYLLPGRGWELLAGALIAVWHSNRRPELPPWFRQSVPAAGLAAILWSVLALKGSTATPAYLMAVPVMGSCAIIAAADGKDVTSRLLSTGPLVFVGLISYSAYLWHQPLFALLRIRSFDEVSDARWLAAIVACLALAAVTWRYVESPARDAKLIPRRAVFSTALAGLVAFSLSGYVAARSTRAHDWFVREGVEGTCYLATRIEDCPSNGADVVLWGDSFADAFAPAFMNAAKAVSIDVHPRVYHSCPSLLGVRRNEAYRLGRSFALACASYAEKTLAFVGSVKPRLVVLSNDFEAYARGVSPIDGRPVLLSDADSRRDGLETVLASLEETVTTLNEQGIAVIVIAPHPTTARLSEGRRRAMLGAGVDVFGIDPTPSRELTRKITERLEHLNASVLSVDGLFCRRDSCSEIDAAGHHLTFDGSHLSPYAAKQLAGLLVKNYLSGERSLQTRSDPKKQ